jgi:hypothetical protein
MPQPASNPPRPAPARDGNTSWLSITLLGVLLLMLLAILLVLSHPQHAREYKLYLSEQRPGVTFQLDELSPTWTESDLRARFAALDWRCYDNRPGEYLDDRSCFADVQSFNGHGAMGLSFYFKAGRLNQAVVNVPWWSHWSALGSLEAQYGPPLASQWLPRAGVRLHGWQLANGGGVFFNRDLPLNPLEWNAIFWRSARECALRPCFVGGARRQGTPVPVAPDPTN